MSALLLRARNSSWATRLFIITTLSESLIDCAILVIALATFRLTSISHDSPSEGSVLPVYLAIFVLAHLFQLYYAFDAIWQKNSIQIWGLCTFNFLFLANAILEVVEMREEFAGKTFLYSLVVVVPIVIGVAQISYSILSFYLYKEFGWTIWKRIGADRTVKSMYMKYQIFICILKFDYFFFIGFSIQYYFLVLHVSNLERYLTLAAVPLSLLLLIGGYIAARKEYRWLMGGFIFGCLCGAAYFILKLFRIFDGKDADYRLVFKSLTLFSGLSLALLILTMCFAVLCWRSFGHGLRSHTAQVPRKKMEEYIDYSEELEGSDGGLYHQYSMKASSPKSRLSID